MSTVTIRPELLAELQAAAEGEGRTAEELTNRLIEQFLRERAEPPDWHVPLVREALERTARGESVAYSRERIVARAERRSS